MDARKKDLLAKKKALIAKKKALVVAKKGVQKRKAAKKVKKVVKQAQEQQSEMVATKKKIVQKIEDFNEFKAEQEAKLANQRSTVSKNIKFNNKELQSIVKQLSAFAEKLSSSNPLLNVEDEFIYIEVTASKLPENYSIRPVQIPLKNPIYTPKYFSKHCIFVRSPQREFKDKIESLDIPCVAKVVGYDKLLKNYTRYQNKRDLCAEYDLFFCDYRIYDLLRKPLGKVFYEKKKIPFPIDCLETPEYSGFSTYEEYLNSLSGSTYFVQGNGPNYTLKVGRVTQKPQEVVANIKQAALELVSHLSLQEGVSWQDIRRICVKTSKSPSIPLYTYLSPEEVSILTGKAKTNNKKRAQQFNHSLIMSKPPTPKVSLSPKIQRIKKHPFREYYALTDLKESAFFTGYIRERMGLKLLFQSRYWKKDPQHLMELSKYLYKGKMIDKGLQRLPWMMAGFLIAFGINSLDEIRYQVRNPCEPIFTNTLWSQIYRVSIFNLFAIFDLVIMTPSVSAAQPGTEIQADVVYSQKFENQMLEHQKNHYIKNRLKTYDFVEIGEEKIYELRQSQFLSSQLRITYLCICGDKFHHLIIFLTSSLSQSQLILCINMLDSLLIERNYCAKKGSFPQLSFL